MDRLPRGAGLDRHRIVRPADRGRRPQRQVPVERPSDGDGGSSTTEMVIVMPLLLTLVLLLAQAALYAHAAHIAQAAAAHALSATRIEDGSAGAGQVEAHRVLSQLGRGPLRDIHIEVDRDAEHAEVRIEGTATSVLPFLRLSVRARTAGPVEKFRSDPHGALTGSDVAGEGEP
ncbi:TadE/TadG family type IV pilus assembly protein [Streptomyces sp. NPDC059009]|uniref:TadE/TadG family type IV pilus assembly protein n=1 Tax=Streptomyces sp. NPDC059009 TaxID=3346694 RepID=UPI0036855317